MTGADHQDELRPPADVGANQTGASVPAGSLSWSWDLDLESLVAAVSEPAPWLRGPLPTPAQPITTAEPDAIPTDPAATPDTGPGTVPASPANSDTSPRADDAASAAEPDAMEAEFAEYLEAVEAGRSQMMPLAVAAGRIAESVPPGPELAGWANAGPVTELEDGALAGIAASYRRLASWAQAGELAAVAELASRSAATDDRIGTDEQGRPARVPDSACAEVSLALTMSQSAASWWTDLAVTLQWRLAATGAALRNGTIDLARARAIAEGTAVLDEDTARAVQDKVLPRASTQTMGQLRAALRRAVIAADPQGADRRREEAERRAKVTLYPDPDGTASLAGYNLPGVPAAAALARITALARALKASGAGGGIDLLRSHVFLGLLLGTLPYIPPPEDAPPDHEPPDPEPPHDDPPDDLPEDEALGYPPGHGPGGDEPPDDGPPPDDQPDHGQLTDSPDDKDCLGEEDSGEEDSPGGTDAHRTGSGCGSGGRDGPGVLWEAEDPGPGARPPPAWPRIRAFLQPGPAAMDNLAPAGGALLDLRLPWATLTGDSPEPGHLSRLGPITPAQARHLADLATCDPAVNWRVIVTNPSGQAIATARIRRPAGASAREQAGLVRQVTVIIGPDDLTAPHPPAGLPPALGRVLAAARQIAAYETTARKTEDRGCAHAEATTAYRPTTRLWDYIITRDLTCRFRTCRQPAARCDVDHTTPFDQGGSTCPCNLGAVCRYHHRKIKQHPGWHLNQPTPGTFTWTTPNGRTYLVQPDAHTA